MALSLPVWSDHPNEQPTTCPAPNPGQAHAVFAMKLPLILWFLLAQIVVCLFFFRDALWGGSLLAPLDIAPALFPKYQFLDPSIAGVPANHYLIDQLDYTLPVHLTIYESLKQGEIPWWDPYSICGRPLLADASISGNDPICWLLYFSLPFEAAYNWTRILQSVLTGLGMLLFLQRWGFKPWVCLLLALAYQFAGCYALYFGHRWIQASFIYYPFLWLAWDEAVNRCRWRGAALASVCVALSIYSGNVQSNACLVVFALAFLIGEARLSWRAWIRLSLLLIGTGLVGACLAAPVLVGQLEFYSISTRKMSSLFHPLSILAGPGSLTAVYPWCLGTFRTLDLGKFCGPTSLGFSLFIGPVAFVLAVLGAWRPVPRAEWRALKWISLAVCAAYVLIISTPLVNLFYMRIAPMAVMGLIILAAIGLETLSADGPWLRRTGWFVLTGAVAVAIVTNVFAWFVYPRIQDKVLSAVKATVGTFDMLGNAPRLRAFQVENLPREISFANPEPLLAFVGLLGLAALLLSPKLRARPPLWCALLVLNLAPVVWFNHRFIPHQPMARWRALLAGGPEQQRVMAQLHDTPLRLFEDVPGPYESVFPRSMGHLYHVRTVQGDSSLFARNLFQMAPEEQSKWKPQLADWIYTSSKTGLAQGEFSPNPTPGLARFQWQANVARAFTVEQLSVNRLRLSVAPGAAATLLWTDTFYPGWRAESDGQKIGVTLQEPCFSLLKIPAGSRTVDLRYEPRFLPLGKILALLGLATLGVMVLAGRRSANSPLNTRS